MSDRKVTMEKNYLKLIRVFPFGSGNGFLLHRGILSWNYRWFTIRVTLRLPTTWLIKIVNRAMLIARKREVIHRLMAVIEFRISREVMVDLTSLSGFTCVSVSISDVATSNLFGLLRYLFCRNCFSNSRSCWDVKAVLGLLVLPSNACCAAQPVTKGKYSIKKNCNYDADYATINSS